MKTTRTNHHAEKPLNLTDETPLYDLTEDQLQDLEIWYRKIHGITDCDSLRSILGNGNEWSMTLGDWTRQQREGATLATSHLTSAARAVLETIPAHRRAEALALAEEHIAGAPVKSVSGYFMQTIVAGMGLGEQPQELVVAMPGKPRKPAISENSAYGEFLRRQRGR